MNWHDEFRGDGGWLDNDGRVHGGLYDTGAPPEARFYSAGDRRSPSEVYAGPERGWVDADTGESAEDRAAKTARTSSFMAGFPADIQVAWDAAEREERKQDAYDRAASAARAALTEKDEDGEPKLTGADQMAAELRKLSPHGRNQPGSAAREELRNTQGRTRSGVRIIYGSRITP